MSVRHARGMTTTITPLALSEAKARLRAVWDRLGDISFETGHVDVSFNAPRDFRSLFASKYGPTVAVYRNIDPARTTDLDHAIDDLVTSFTRRPGADEVAIPPRRRNTPTLMGPGRLVRHRAAKTGRRPLR